MAGVDLGTAFVTLRASTTGFQPDVKRALGQAERDSAVTGRKMGDSMSSSMSGRLKGGVGAMGRMMTVGLVGAATAAGLGAAAAIGAGIQNASALQQSIGGVEAVFKGQAGQITAAAKGAALNLGLTQNAYNELATVLGSSLKNKGITDFANQSQNLVGIGADLAAQFGGSTKDAADALAAALRGESDPIERYGVSLNESAVNAELAARGQSKLKGAALETAKTQARLTLITKQTSDAHGAFARESDTLAGKQQRASAMWEDLTATIGTRLLPVLTDVMTVLVERVLPGFEGMANWVSANQGTVGLLAGSIGILTGAMAAMAAGTWILNSGLVAMTVALLANPWTWVVVGIVAVGAALVALVQNWGAVTSYITGVFAPIAAWLDTTVWQPVQAGMRGIGQTFAGVGTFLAGVWTSILGGFAAAATWVSATFGPIWSGFVYPVLMLPINLARMGITAAWTMIRGMFTAAATWVATTFAAGWNLVAGMLAGPMNSGKNAITGAWNAVKGAFSAAWSFVSFWVATKWAQLNSLMSGPINAGKRAIDGALGGVKLAFSTAVNAVKQIWSGIQEAVKAPIRFVVDVVINKGLIDTFNKVAEFAQSPKMSHVSLPRGFAAGGYTGAGAKFEPAGIVHRGEYVMDKATVQAAGGPGVFDQMRAGLRGYASGGSVGAGAYRQSAQKVAAYVARLFGLAVPSTAPAGRPQSGRYGYTSDHPRGMAADFMIPNWQRDKSVGYRLNAWLHQNAAQTGLKYTVWDRYSYPLRLGGRKGSRLNRGDPTNNHEDHVHASFRDVVASLSGMSGVGDLSGAMDPLGGFMQGIKDKLGGWTKSLGGMGIVGQAAGGIAKRAVDGMAGLAGRLSSALLDSGVAKSGFDLGQSARAGVDNLTAKAQVRALAAGRGWGGGDQWNALDWIIQHESGWNPQAKNPTSSAYGLFQFLSGTQRQYGYGRDVISQAQGGMRYIGDRYGTPTAAKAFWERNRWYADGTDNARPGWAVVGERGPELMRMRGGEQVISNENLLAALGSRGSAAGQTSIHVEKHMHRDDEDIARAILNGIEQAGRRRQLAASVV